MIAESIPKTQKSLQERGLPNDSFFVVIFEDGSTVSELDTNWSSFSRKEVVDYFGQKRVFFISNHPISGIKIKLNELEAGIEEVPEGAEVYQFIQSERLIAHGIDKPQIVGRGIGLIKNGSVIEERYINAHENRVEGVRK